MTIPLSACVFLAIIALVFSIAPGAVQGASPQRVLSSKPHFRSFRGIPLAIAVLFGLLGVYRALAQTSPTFGPLTFSGVTSSSVVVHLPVLPTGATSFSLQRASASAVPAPPTTGLRVWLKADAVPGQTNDSALASWPDSSSHGQNATQSNAWQQPHWMADAVNGRPAIKMDGDDDLLQLPDQGDIRTVFVVFRHHTGYQNYSPMLGSQNTRFHGGADNYLFSDQWTPSEVKNGDIFLNGQAVTATQVTKPTSFSLISLVTTAPVNVNSLSTQTGTYGRNWNGDYAEVMLYNTALSTTDRQAVEAYLMAKYALGNPASGLTWTTIETGLASEATYEDTGLDANSRYVYRCVAVGSDPDAEGAPAAVTTLPGSGNPTPPDPPAAPSVLGATATAVDLKQPALPTGATTLTLQRASGTTPAAPPSSGLKVWFKADAVTGVADGGGVSNWPDSSGGGHNATQADASHRPTLLASGINGRPALRFNGNSQYFTTNWFGPGTSGVTIFLVAKGSDYRSLVQMQRDDDWLIYPWGGASNQPFINRYDGGSYDGIGSGLVPGEVNIGSAIWQPGTTNGVRTYRNGRLVAQRDSNGNPLPQGTLRIGTHPAIAEFPTADVSEILIYSSALSDSQRESVENYLASKYGVATRQPSNLTWTSIATGQAALATHSDTDVTGATTYWYRSLAVGAGGSTPGDAVAVTTLAAAPAAPLAPTFPKIGATHLDVLAPALPLRATSLTLQKKADGDPDTSYSDVATGLNGGASTPVTDLTAETTYQFRFLAIGEGGATAGEGASVTTNDIDPPGVAEAPTFTDVTSTTVDVHLPALTERSTWQSLQRATASGPVATTPPSSGLQLWLKADAITGVANGGSVGNWPDSSGGGHAATQNNSANQPKWIAGALNGRPVVRLDGNDDYLDIPTQDGVRTAFVVVRHATGSQDWTPLLGSPSTQVHGGPGTDLFSSQYTSEAVRNSTAYLNGQNVPTLSISKPTSFSVISLAMAGTVSINSLSCQAGVGGRNWNGDYAEVLLYNTELSPEERQSVEGYLYNKYNLGTPPSNLIWTTVATGLTGSSTYQDTGLDANTRYFYRAAPHGPGGATAGKVASVVTAPPAPLAPEIINVGASHLTVLAPALPEGALSLTLQQKEDGQDDSVYVNVATGLSAGQSTLIQGLTPQHTYDFRCVAVGPNGSTPGAVAVKTTNEFEPPAAPDAPSFTAVGSTKIELKMPALPAGATSLTLQRAVGTGADVSQPPHATANGLRLWLRADSLRGLTSGNSISTWPSDGAAGTDATQTDAASRPKWIAGALNGRPAVRLDGDNDYLDIPNQTGIRTVLAVVRHATGSQDYAPLLGSPSYDLHGGIGSTLFGPYTPAPVASGQAFLNGVSTPVLSLAKPTSFSLISLVTTQGITINSLSRQSGNDGRNWNGDYAEVLLYDTALSTADRQSAENYLRAKYGMEEAPGGLSWTTVATGLSGDAPYTDEPLTPETHYFYRCVAVGTTGETIGATASTITRAAHSGPPEPPAAPTVLGDTAPAVDLKLPPLSEGSTSHSVQRATQIAPSTPPSSGLGVWFKADSLSGLADGGAITTWTDSSGGGHDAYQYSAPQRPTYVASGIGGQPSVHFSGDGQYFFNNLIGPGGSGVSIFVVAKGSNYQSMVRFQGYMTSYLVYPWGTGSKFINGEDGGTGVGLDSGLIPGEANIGSAIWKANTTNGMRTYRNGVLVAQRNSNNSTLPVEPLRIGCYLDGAGDYTAADISEILIYNTALSDEDRQSVEQYLAQKYAVQTSAPTDLDWTTIATEKAGNALLTDTPVTAGTTYWYRCVGVGPGGSTPGAAVSVTPHGAAPAAPEAPGAPTFEDIATTSLKVVAPALPTGATSLTLQQKLPTEDDTAYVDVATAVEADSRTLVTGLSPATTYRFRFVAVGAGGNTPGTSADATTASDSSDDTVTAQDDTYSVAQNAELNVPASGVLGNDSGPQGGTLSALVDTNPTHGTLVLNVDGSFVYTPSTDFQGSDSFTYKAKSGTTESLPATVTITVVAGEDPPTNSAPVASDGTLTTDEDTAADGTLSATDADDDELTFTIVTQPAHGSVTLGQGGAYTYTPEANFNGTYSFTFKANDTIADSNIATVSITVTAVNDAPTAENGTFTTAFNTAVETPLVGADVDGDTLSYEVTAQPVHGTLSGTAPALTYTPEADYHGEDSFAFKASDGTLYSAPATIHITVSPQANRTPVALTHNYEMAEDQVLHGQLEATDADGDTLTYSGPSSTSLGILTIESDGAFVYTPKFHSTTRNDSFSFQVSDGTAIGAANISIHITDVPDAPVAANGTYTTPQNEAVDFTLDGHDDDGDAIQYSIVTSPQHGTITSFNAGPTTQQPSLSYKPAADYIGTDTLTYKVSDGTLESNTGTITFTVEPAQNDSPPGFDALIRQGATGSFIGNDIYNATASSQTLYPILASNLTSTYEVQIQNEGTEARSFTVTGAAGGNGWQPRYYDAATEGEEITEEVTAEGGWSTPSIAAGGSLTLRVVLSALPTPTAEEEAENENAWNRDVLISVSDAMEDVSANSTDAVKLQVHYRRGYRPDAQVSLAKSPLSSGEIFGDDIYTSYDEDGVAQNAGQILKQLKGAETTASYYVYAQNDGVSPDHLRLSGPAGNSKWTVHYFDAPTGGQDITSEITGDGCLTPELTTGQIQTIRVEVNIGLTADFEVPFELAVKVSSAGEGTGSSSDDTVVLSTTRERLDLSIYKAKDSNTPVAPGVGVGINNADGQNQSVTQKAYSHQKVTFMVGSQITDSGSTYLYKAPACDENWTISYYYGDVDITNQITGAGWEHLIVSNSLTGQLDNGDDFKVWDPFRVEVTPVGTVGIASSKTLLIKATTLNGTQATDAVQAIIERGPAMDASIKPVYQENYTGEGIHNTDGTDQTVGYSQNEGESETAVFQINVRNLGNESDSFVLKAPASSDGWTLHYFDAEKDGNDITTQVTSTTGWTSDSTLPWDFEYQIALPHEPNPNPGIFIRLEATPDAAVAGGVFSSALIQATSVLDGTVTDAVKATYGSQRIAKLQYTLDQGVTWIDAPLASSGEAIPGPAKQVIGVRAVRQDPNLPWPFEPDIKPAWDHASYWYVGEAVWIECGAPSAELRPIQAQCGNTVIANIQFVESYRVSLRASKTYVPLGGGELGQMALTARVIKSDGQPATGMTVRFVSQFENGTAAGQIGGPGSSDDQAVTDAEGNAVVNLTTGTQGGAVKLQAFVVQGGQDTAAARSQEVVFGLPEVGSGEPEPEIDSSVPQNE